MNSKARLAVVGCLTAWILVASSGCTDLARQKLIGEWQVGFQMSDSEARRLVPTQNSLVAAIGQTFLQSLRADFKLKFHADDSMEAALTALGTTIHRTGKWRLVRAQGDSMTIAVNLENDPNSREWILEFDGNHAFTTTPLMGDSWQLDRRVTLQRIPSERS